MRTVLLLSVVLLAGCASAGDAPPHASGVTCSDAPCVPGALDPAWHGFWKGESEVAQPNGTTGSAPTSLEIEPIDDASWAWRIIYGEGEGVPVRDYVLRVADAEQGLFTVDERNGIEIDMRLVGRGLYGRFVVGEADIHVSYELSEDGEAIEMTLVTYRVPADMRETGGEGGMPVVTTVLPIGVQRGVLERVGEAS